MYSLSIPALAAIFAVLGGVITWLALRTRSEVLKTQVLNLDQTLTAVRGEFKTVNSANAELRDKVAALNSTLLEERKTNAEKLKLLTAASAELRSAFQALAAEALQSNNESFLQLAKTRLEKYQAEAKGELEARQKAVENLVAPIQKSLTEVDNQIHAIEEARNQAYGSLTRQVASLITTQEQLRSETGNLVKALRTPTVRGQWGEIQLKRVVEIAGMLPYCDFVEQETVQTSEGRLRPDLIVKLPGGKNVVVDAKTPLEAYLKAVESNDDETRRVHLAGHARQVRDHMTRLSSKAYWEQFDSSPEFVVMFLPGETFFSAALEQDHGLIEEGVNQGVIPASPTTLIALLKAVAYGWKQERIAESAQQISALGKELYERLLTFASHLDTVGKGLDRAVESYNKAVGSLESRVLVSARRFPELVAGGIAEIPEPQQIETTTRTLALEWPEEEDPATDHHANGATPNSSSGD